MAGGNMLTGVPLVSPQMQVAALAKQQLDALTYVHDQFASLASKPDLNFDDVVNMAANLVRTKIATSDQVATQLSEVPRERGKMRAWAMLKQADAAEHAQRLMQQNMGV